MRKRLLLVVSLFVASSPAWAAVTIDRVLVGNPSNSADIPGNCVGSPVDCGSVDHAYSISKHETTNAQYAEFLNAKAASDPVGLYNAGMGSDSSSGGITQSGSEGSYSYAVTIGFANKPVTYVSFYDALRFANWLNNGQGSADTETGAYTITPDGITNNTITRNPGAQIFLPNENEWYKAAYFDGAGYFVYPAGVDAQTTCAIPGAPPNTANCQPGGPLAVTDVGAYTGSASPSGTFDQGGNVWEWNESASGSDRGFRGGSWLYVASYLAASFPYGIGFAPTSELAFAGFRVASLVVPEPGPGWLGMTAALTLAAWRKRTRRPTDLDLWRLDPFRRPRGLLSLPIMARADLLTHPRFLAAGALERRQSLDGSSRLLLREAKFVEALEVEPEFGAAAEEVR